MNGWRGAPSRPAPVRIYRGPRNSSPRRIFDFCRTSEMAPSRSTTSLRCSSFGRGIAGERTSIILLQPTALQKAASSTSCGSRPLNSAASPPNGCCRGRPAIVGLIFSSLNSAAVSSDSGFPRRAEVPVDAAVAELRGEPRLVGAAHARRQRPVERHEHSVGGPRGAGGEEQRRRRRGAFEELAAGDHGLHAISFPKDSGPDPET